MPVRAGVSVFLFLAMGACRPAAAPEFCRNGLDDDQDGLIDCEDEECSTRIQCTGAFILPEQATETYEWPGGGDGVLAAISWRGDMDGDGLLDVGATGIYGGKTDASGCVTGQDARVYVYPSTQRDGSGAYSFPDAAVAWAMPTASLIGPSATTGCDLDGDGLHDLVVVDTYAALFCYSPPAAPRLRILHGTHDLAVEPPPVRTILLPTSASVLAEVYCVGDVDGDGGGDLVLTGLDQPVRLLPSSLVATASTLAEATSRTWDAVVARVEAVGDLDGDGFDEIQVFGEEWTSADLDASDAWELFSILPGSADLGVPRSALTFMDGELRRPTRVYTEARANLRSADHSSMFFADLDGDDSPELMAGIHTAEYSHEVFLADTVARLDGDVVLRAADRRAGFLAFDPADPGSSWAASGPSGAGDVDGDGNIDLVGVGGVEVAAGIVDPAFTWDTTEGTALGGALVWFGDGAMQSMQRLPDEIDALVARPGPYAQLTPARTAKTGLDLALMGGLWVGVFPTELITGVAGR